MDFKHVKYFTAQWFNCSCVLLLVYFFATFQLVTWSASSSHSTHVLYTFSSTSASYKADSTQSLTDSHTEKGPFFWASFLLHHLFSFSDSHLSSPLLLALFELHTERVAFSVCPLACRRKYCMPLIRDADASERFFVRINELLTRRIMATDQRWTSDRLHFECEKIDWPMSQ